MDDELPEWPEGMTLNTPEEMALMEDAMARVGKALEGTGILGVAMVVIAPTGTLMASLGATGMKPLALLCARAPKQLQSAIDRMLAGIGEIKVKDTDA